MPERVFKSPGFFEQEIDLSQRQQRPFGVPAGIIGTAEKGPAFVPVTVGSFADFKTKFGTLDSKKFGPYAVNEFLKNRDAVTYMRVLGAGSNTTLSDISVTQNQGRVKNAGFVVTGSATDLDFALRRNNIVQFLSARHTVSGSETYRMPMFTDNDSFDSGLTNANIVRAVLFSAAGTRFQVGALGTTFTKNMPDGTYLTDTTSTHFKLYLSTSAGSSFANDDGIAGVRIYTASLDPDNQQYIGNVLNTDPSRFGAERHLLYLDFAVDAQLAYATSVAIMSGTSNTSTSRPFTIDGAALTFENMFGHFDSRYSGATSTNIISQPFGLKEYNLFTVSTLDDGAYPNDKIKISIANLRASVDPADEYGEFDILVRDYNDTDQDPEILEQFNRLSLNPQAPNYFAAAVGDSRAYFKFDAEQKEERRLVVEGKYPNLSTYIRVTPSDEVANAIVPAAALPFGFRGLAVLKTSDTLNDFDLNPRRLAWASGTVSPGREVAYSEVQYLSSSIVPPLPFRYKVTKGIGSSTENYQGQKGPMELVDGRLYWGVKFERNKKPMDPNPSSEKNLCVKSFGKMMGIAKLDALVTGSGADTFNNNKFTLARVALYNQTIPQLTASAADHMLEAAYIRNGVVNPTTYKIADAVNVGAGAHNRVTFACLVHSSSVEFNRFTDFAKFNILMGGGSDGINILDKSDAEMGDRATSRGAGGNASSQSSSGFNFNQAGSGKYNNAVFAYRSAVEILTDPLISNVNLLAIPGIREPFVTNHAADLTRAYAMAMYALDLEEYSDSSVRLYGSGSVKASVRRTREQFDSRAISNNYVATYFPDVVIDDEVNNQRVRVPASVAALSAISFNDKVGYPWFAPAGFNRGALDFVKQVDIRLSASDRDALYESRINPIATFPTQGFAIFGQKTLQFTKSALDRVNVRRLMLEVKRLVIRSAEKILFEPNTPATRSRFVSDATPLLANIQTQAGIEDFRVIMDGTNNSQTDVESNRLNGRIVVVPTRAIEFIAIDFIITNAGVSFE